MENERDNSVFIRESKRVRNKSMAVIVIIDLLILIPCGVFCYAALFGSNIAEKIISVIVLVAIEAAIMWSLISKENKKFKRFAETIYDMDNSIFTDLENQAAISGKMFGVFYLLEDYLYICNRNAFIPYTDIKKIHSHSTSYNFIPVETSIRIDCFSGKVYVTTVRSVFEYNKRKSEFENMLNQYRQRSFEKNNGQNINSN